MRDPHPFLPASISNPASEEETWHLLSEHEQKRCVLTVGVALLSNAEGEMCMFCVEMITDEGALHTRSVPECWPGPQNTIEYLSAQAQHNGIL